MGILRRMAALAWAVAMAPAMADGGAGDHWAVRLTPAQDVVFKGMPRGEDGGSAGAMMYPAPNIAGLVAGIVTHGVIASSIQDNAKTRSEKLADKVIDPYRASLAGFGTDALGRAALEKSTLGGARLLSGAETAGGNVIDSTPIFYMTPLRDALVLDNSVVVMQGAGQPYRNTVRVVSRRHEADDLRAYWGADDAQVLKSEAAALLALSLDIATGQAGKAVSTGGAGAQYRTVRYLLGAQESFERAEVLDERCGRALLRNLRGWLMSVPLSKPARPAEPDSLRCPPSPETAPPKTP
jgi:hypothetical protein